MVLNYWMEDDQYKWSLGVKLGSQYVERHIRHVS
jgi:hypothetical protein